MDVTKRGSFKGYFIIELMHLKGVFIYLVEDFCKSGGCLTLANRHVHTINFYLKPLLSLSTKNTLKTISTGMPQIPDLETVKLKNSRPFLSKLGF